MANVSLKTDFTDGEKLFGQQLNNNFAVIKAALEAMNKIVWQDDPDDSVSAFRGTTEEINQRDIIDGQLLYDTTTGETYIDVGSQRISTGSGNAIHIGSDTPTNPSTQIWIDPNEPLQLIGTEVVNSMEGTESNKAPSVASVKTYINDKVQDVYSTDEIRIGTWIDGKPIYRKAYYVNAFANNSNVYLDINVENVDTVISANGYAKNSSHTETIFLNSSYSNAICDAIVWEESANKLRLHSTSDRSGYSGYVWIEYTKTTD